MAHNTEVIVVIEKIETPNGQFLIGEEDEMSPAERAIIERVLALSLEEQSNKAWLKSSGLSSKYRKLISSMKMTKSSQKCTICYSEFAENQIIKKLPCKHIFHRDCAKSWLKVNHNCPNCRLDLQNHFQNLEKQSKLPINPPQATKVSKVKQILVQCGQKFKKSTFQSHS